MFRSILLILVLVCIVQGTARAGVAERIHQLIDQGEFTVARQWIRDRIADTPDMDPLLRLDLEFQLARMDRIRKDFTLSREEVLTQIREVTDVSEADLDRWERSAALEMMVIDGEKRYFQWAVPNLFRIDPEMRRIKAKKQSSTPPTFNRLTDARKTIRSSREQQSRIVRPTRFRITYSLTVEAGAVPAGETVRCWLPYPMELPPRQTDIELIGTTPDNALLSPSRRDVHRSVYLEATARTQMPTEFQAVFEYTQHGVFVDIDPEQVRSTENPGPALQPYLEERAPHIVFTPQLRDLSRRIVGDETNPYRIAQKLFAWIDRNIPWASAREYSTFKNVSDYVYQNRHADCGMQTLFFVTLCRMNGIPARWQSGWYVEPSDWTMHDWGEIFFEPYGWVPMDVTYGQLDSRDPAERWFLLHGMDPYRLIVNNNYSQSFYPAKIHHRSETIDFQRGEVEWRGGNLYFDQWDWTFRVEVVE